MTCFSTKKWGILIGNPLLLERAKVEVHLIVVQAVKAGAVADRAFPGSLNTMKHWIYLFILYIFHRSRSRSRSSEIDGYRLHIADIGDEVRKSDLEKVFSGYGALKEVWMTNSTPCFGFAVFKDKKAAASALKATDGM